MTVAELIEKLRRFDPEDKVVVALWNGEPEEWAHMEAYSVCRGLDLGTVEIS